MQRREFLAAAGGLAGLAAMRALDAANPAERPNILIFYADDLAVRLRRR